VSSTAICGSIDLPMRRVVPIFAASLLIPLATLSAHAQAPVGEVYSSDASVHGSVTMVGSGMQVMSGSQVAAGARPATLRLARGGTIRICPNTIVTVSSSMSGRSLLYSVSKGEIEFHFDLSSDGDAVQTPDYRVQFIGPGHFELAMCANERGELRLRGKNSNAAIIVSEMLGDGVYQAPAGTALDFHGGSVRDVTPADGMLCGCADPPPLPQEQQRTIEVTKQEAPPAPVAQPVLPPETHVQIDAPFIFHGDEPNSDTFYTVAKMGIDKTLTLKLAPTVLPPSKKKSAPATVSTVAMERPKKESRGFFRRIGSFFGKIFGS
jgi:hypothetical protein